MKAWPVLNQEHVFRVYKAPAGRHHNRGLTHETINATFPFKRVVLSQDDIDKLKSIVDESSTGTRVVRVLWQSCEQMTRLVDLEWNNDAYPGLDKVVFNYVTVVWPQVCNYNTKMLKAKILEDMTDECAYNPEQVVELVSQAIAWRNNVTKIYHRYQAALHMQRCFAFATKAPDMTSALVNPFLNIGPSGFVTYMVHTFPDLPSDVTRRTGQCHLGEFVCMFYFRLRGAKKGPETVRGAMDATTDNRKRKKSTEWSHLQDMQKLFAAAMYYTYAVQSNVVERQKLDFDPKNRTMGEKRKREYMEKETNALCLSNVYDDFKDWLENREMRDVAAILSTNTLVAYKSSGKGGATGGGRYGKMWEVFRRLIWGYASLSGNFRDVRGGSRFVTHSVLTPKFGGNTKNQQRRLHYKKAKQEI